MDKFCQFLNKIMRNHCMAIYRDTGVFYLSITGTDNFQYRPLLIYIYIYIYHHIYKAEKPSVCPSAFDVSRFSRPLPHALKRFRCQMKRTPSGFVKFVVRRL